MEYFIGALKKYADFKGRARRKEYWMFTLIYIILYAVLTGVGIAAGLEFLTVIFALGMLVPSISIGARRLHDTGRSGWWQLLNLIPLLGSIVLIVFLAQDSHENNNYGENGWGAIEFAVRLSSMDLMTANAGTLEDITVGINWYLNPNTRVMLNYVMGEMINGEEIITEDAVMMRVQLSF